MGRTFRKERDWDQPKYKRKVSRYKADIYVEEDDIDYAEDLHTEEACVRRKQTSKSSKKYTRRVKK